MMKKAIYIIYAKDQIYLYRKSIYLVILQSHFKIIYSNFIKKQYINPRAIIIDSGQMSSKAPTIQNRLVSGPAAGYIISDNKPARPSTTEREWQKQAAKQEAVINFEGSLENYKKLVDNKNSMLGNRFSDFELIKELGHGSYGTIYLVRSKAEVQQCKMQMTTGAAGQMTTANFHSTQDSSKMLNTTTVGFGQSGALSTANGYSQVQGPEGKRGSAPKTNKAPEPMSYILKKIHLSETKMKQQLAAMREAYIMSQLDHPNIIKFYTSFLEGDNLYILMEYASQGDLYQVLKDQRIRKKYLCERDLWCYAYQLLLAVDYIHQRDVIHRDIKCLNIFLSENKIIKLGDLGVSKVQKYGHCQLGTRVGTPLYLAPELVKANPYDHKIDMWAIGCALYHLACLEPPFSGDNLINLGQAITSKKPKAIPHVYSQRLKKLIESLLSKHARDRPNTRHALNQVPSFVIQMCNEKFQECETRMPPLLSAAPSQQNLAIEIQKQAATSRQKNTTINRAGSMNENKSLVKVQNLAPIPKNQKKKSHRKDSSQRDQKSDVKIEMSPKQVNKTNRARGQYMRPQSGIVRKQGLRQNFQSNLQNLNLQVLRDTNNQSAEKSKSNPALRIDAANKERLLPAKNFEEFKRNNEIESPYQKSSITRRHYIDSPSKIYQGNNNDCKILGAKELSSIEQRMKYISSHASNKSPGKRANNSFSNGDGSAMSNRAKNLVNKDDVQGDIKDFYIERQKDERQNRLTRSRNIATTKTHSLENFGTPSRNFPPSGQNKSETKRRESLVKPILDNQSGKQQFNILLCDNSQLRAHEGSAGDEGSLEIRQRANTEEDQLPRRYMARPNANNRIKNTEGALGANAGGQSYDKQVQNAYDSSPEGAKSRPPEPISHLRPGPRLAGPIIRSSKNLHRQQSQQSTIHQNSQPKLDERQSISNLNLQIVDSGSQHAASNTQLLKRQQINSASSRGGSLEHAEGTPIKCESPPRSTPLEHQALLRKRHQQYAAAAPGARQGSQSAERQNSAVSVVRAPSGLKVRRIQPKGTRLPGVSALRAATTNINSQKSLELVNQTQSHTNKRFPQVGQASGFAVTQSSNLVDQQDFNPALAHQNIKINQIIDNQHKFDQLLGQKVDESGIAETKDNNQERNGASSEERKGKMARKNTALFRETQNVFQSSSNKPLKAIHFHVGSQGSASSGQAFKNQNQRNLAASQAKPLDEGMLSPPAGGNIVIDQGPTPPHGTPKGDSQQQAPRSGSAHDQKQFAEMLIKIDGQKIISDQYQLAQKSSEVAFQPSSFDSSTHNNYKAFERRASGPPAVQAMSESQSIFSDKKATTKGQQYYSLKSQQAGVKDALKTLVGDNRTHSQGAGSKDSTVTVGMIQGKGSSILASSKRTAREVPTQGNDFVALAGIKPIQAMNASYASSFHKQEQQSLWKPEAAPGAKKVNPGGQHLNDAARSYGLNFSMDHGGLSGEGIVVGGHDDSSADPSDGQYQLRQVSRAARTQIRVIEKSNANSNQSSLHRPQSGAFTANKIIGTKEARRLDMKLNAVKSSLNCSMDYVQSDTVRIREPHLELSKRTEPEIEVKDQRAAGGKPAQDIQNIQMRRPTTAKAQISSSIWQRGSYSAQANRANAYGDAAPHTQMSFHNFDSIEKAQESLLTNIVTLADQYRPVHPPIMERQNLNKSMNEMFKLQGPGINNRSQSSLMKAVTQSRFYQPSNATPKDSNQIHLGTQSVVSNSHHQNPSAIKSGKQQRPPSSYKNMGRRNPKTKRRLTIKDLQNNS